MDAQEQYAIVDMPDGARMTCMTLRGADVLGMANALAVGMFDGDEDMARAFGDELGETACGLVGVLHDAAEANEAYIASLLYASATLAMTALGQLDADEAAWRLAHADSLDDLMGGDGE